MDTFAALSDPSRRQILEHLKSGPKSSGEIAERFQFSNSATSQHLKILREAHLVTVTKDAQRRVYEINFQTIEQATQWLAELQQFWIARLNLLEENLQQK